MDAPAHPGSHGPAMGQARFPARCMAAGHDGHTAMLLGRGPVRLAVMQQQGVDWDGTLPDLPAGRGTGRRRRQRGDDDLTRPCSTAFRAMPCSPCTSIRGAGGGASMSWRARFMASSGPGAVITFHEVGGHRGDARRLPTVDPTIAAASSRDGWRCRASPPAMSIPQAAAKSSP